MIVKKLPVPLTLVQNSWRCKNCFICP